MPQLSNRLSPVSILALMTVFGQAEAIPVLSISNNAGDTIVITDGSALDSHAGDGVVTFVGGIAGWDVVISTGLSSPAIGSPTEPMLHLSSVAVSSYTGGTLSIGLSDAGFMASGDASYRMAIGGYASGAISYSAFADGTDTAFGTSNSLGILGPFTGGAFSGALGGSMSLTSPFSLTTVVDITHAAGKFQHSSFDAVIAVPEPGTLALLLASGLMLIAVTVTVTRRQRVPISR